MNELTNRDRIKALRRVGYAELGVCPNCFIPLTRTDVDVKECDQCQFVYIEEDHKK